MAKSPLRRNRRFERIALPILLVLFVVVMGRQLRASTGSSGERCEIRIEGTHVSHEHSRHAAERRAARHHARHERRHHRTVQIDVIRDVDAQVARDVEQGLVREVVHVER